MTATKIDVAEQLQGIVPTANLGTGTASSSTFLRGDQTYAVPSAPSLPLNVGYVATTEGTTSTSYTDLATTSGQPATATIGSSGNALVILSAEMSNTALSAFSYMGFAASGANTVAADDSRAVTLRSSATTTNQTNDLIVPLTGLSPGSTVFTPKFKASAGTASFTYRRITVIPL